MGGEIEFLRSGAAELRGLVQRAPEIADALRRMADELEGRAAELERNENDPSPSGEL